MKQLLKLGIVDVLISLFPVLLYVLTGILFDSSYREAFTYSYFMQFYLCVFWHWCISGSLKYQSKCDPEHNHVDAGIYVYLGIELLSALVIVVFRYQIAAALNFQTEDAINLFLSGSVLLFADYAADTIFRKWQYEDKSKRALVVMILWFAQRALTLVLYHFMADEYSTMMMRAYSVTQFIFAIVFCIMCCNFWKLRVRLLQWLKYSIYSVSNHIGMLLIYLNGTPHIMQDESTLTAYNILSLSSDTQWDAVGSIDTHVTLRVLSGTWNKKLKRQLVTEVALYASGLVVSSVMMLAAFLVYESPAVIHAACIMFVLEIVTMPISAFKHIIVAYVQIARPTKALAVSNFVQVFVRLATQIIAVPYLGIYGLSVGLLTAQAAGVIMCAAIYHKTIKLQREGTNNV